jgi:hypothetical protein
MFRALWPQDRNSMGEKAEDAESLLTIPERPHEELPEPRRATLSISRLLLLVSSYGLVALLGAWLGRIWTPDAVALCARLTSRYCTYAHDVQCNAFLLK